MSVSLFYMCVNVRTFPDLYWVGMCWLYNRRLPKTSGSLTSMIFPTPDHQGFWWFLFNPKTKRGTGKMKKSFFLITYALWAIVFLRHQQNCMPSPLPICVDWPRARQMILALLMWLKIVNTSQQPALQMITAIYSASHGALRAIRDIPWYKRHLA